LLRRTSHLCYLLFLTFSLLLPTSTYATTHAPGVAHPSQAIAVFPVVDPLYIYNQLSYLTTNFQRREAGYITNQGHDRFAAYWTWANLVMFSSMCPSTLLAFWKIIFIDFFGVTVYN
jgi:hypothetical protein